MLNQQVEQPIIIAGMGPAGLVAALESAKKGHNVIIIEPRSEFTRVQRLLYDATTKKYLHSLRDPNDVNDTKFFEHQINERESSVQLKDVQTYLLRKLTPFANVEIRRGPSHEILAISAKDQTVQVKNKDQVKTIAFSHFVASDGARRNMAKALGDKNPQYEINFSHLGNFPRQAESGTVSLQLREGVAVPLKPKVENKFQVSDLTLLRKLGWQEDYFPRIYILSNRENTKLFISGEIPKSIHSLQDETIKRQVLEAWAQVLVRIKLGYPQNAYAVIEKPNINKDTKRAEKNRFKTTDFMMDLTYADTPALMLGKKGCFALLGDACKNAYFLASHGMNDAILDGIKFASFLDETGKFDHEQYNLYQQEQIRKMSRKIEDVLNKQEMVVTKATMDTTVKMLLKVAKAMHDPALKKQISSLKGMAEPLSHEFNAPDYYREMMKLFKLMDVSLAGGHQPKIRKGFFHSKLMFTSDNETRKSLENLQTKLDTCFRSYLEYNLEPCRYQRPRI